MSGIDRAGANLQAEICVSPFSTNDNAKKIHGLAIGFLYNRMKRLSLYLDFSPKRKAAAFH